MINIDKQSKYDVDVLKLLLSSLFTEQSLQFSNNYSLNRRKNSKIWEWYSAIFTTETWKQRNMRWHPCSTFTIQTFVALLLFLGSWPRCTGPVRSPACGRCCRKPRCLSRLQILPEWTSSELWTTPVINVILHKNTASIWNAVWKISSFSYNSLVFGIKSYCGRWCVEVSYNL